VGHRLSKIYTRTGDKGSTGLGNGARVDKDSARIEAIGSVDELNSALGLLLTHELPAAVQQTLTQVQHRLFDLGSELSIPGATMLAADEVAQLEQALDQLNAELAPLKEFILPGGAPAAALCHLARTICRRAERRVVTLAKQESVNPHSVMYLNRLSDLLFVVARSLNKQAGVPEVLWQSRFSRA
jgi:cob(I)alamin adenosyltransferase